MEQQQQPTGTAVPHSSRLPIFSLISGIFALISCCTPPMQMLLGATAIILAYLSRQGKPLRGMALVGLILGILSVVCSLFIFFQYMAAMQIMSDPANAGLVKEVIRQYQAILEQLQLQ